jgi:hypothetical protein
VTNVARHARGLIIAIVVLLLSAGLVLAAKAMPAASSHGLETAAEAAGHAVPVRAGQSDEQTGLAEEDGEVGEEPEAEAPEAEEPASDDADAAAAGAHGAIVSEAAQMETPEGFANHGAWVSCVTHLTKLPVEEGAEPLTLADITPEACAAAAEAKQAAKAAAKAARDAAKAEREAARDEAKAEREAARDEAKAARDAAKAAKKADSKKP